MATLGVTQGWEGAMCLGLQAGGGLLRRPVLCDRAPQDGRHGALASRVAPRATVIDVGGLRQSGPGHPHGQASAQRTVAGGGAQYTATPGWSRGAASAQGSPGTGPMLLPASNPGAPALDETPESRLHRSGAPPQPGAAPLGRACGATGTQAVMTGTGPQHTVAARPGARPRGLRGRLNVPAAEAGPGLAAIDLRTETIRVTGILGDTRPT